MTFQTIEEELQFVQKRYQIISTLEMILSDKGNIKVEPDLLEDYLSFMKQNTRVNPTSVVTLIDRNGDIKALRPDITTNIIQQVIPKWNQTTPMKLFYNAMTFEYKNQSIEQIRELGVEVLGDNTKQADYDMISLIIELLETFHIPYALEIGYPAWMEQLLVECDISPETTRAIKQAIYAKDQTKLHRLTTAIPDSNSKQLLQDILTFEGSISSLKTTLKKYDLSITLQHMVDVLVELSKEISLDNTSNMMIDLSALSKYDYYSGITYKVYVNKSHEPLIQGGRYDSLTEQFGSLVPALGFSLRLQDFIEEVLQNE